MRIFKITTALILLFTFSCQSWKKQDVRKTAADEAAAIPSYEVENEEHIATFNKLMSNPSDAEKSRNFANYLDRQKNFFYIGEQSMFQFDEKLDALYNKTLLGLELSEEDIEEFDKVRFQNYVAWEFSERNLHEMLDLYYLALKHAHTEGSPFQKSSQWIVPNVKKWVDESWKKGDKSAVITLANHLNKVNEQFSTEQANVLAPSFQAYLNPSQAMLSEAFNRSKWLVKHRKKTHFDNLIEKKWKLDFAQRNSQFGKEFLELNKKSRMPQALDVLEPSADGRGHVTGNRFPMGKWAMTFDDGPNPTHTQGMINSLVSNDVHGTFFWQTQNVIKYPEIPKTKSSRFSRALHSYTHANLPKLSPAGLDKEINLAVKDFAKVVGEKPTMFRCPYGSCGGNGSAIRQMIADNNMLHIHWNVDTLDWQDKNPETIFQRSKKQIDSLGRGIVLFHDIHPQSVIATDKVIKYLKSKYKIEPLNKLIEESRGKPYYTP